MSLFHVNIAAIRYYQENGEHIRDPNINYYFSFQILVLQRLTEFMEYSHLLHKASEATDPTERMQVSFIQIFVVFVFENFIKKVVDIYCKSIVLGIAPQFYGVLNLI